jgi:phenylacetate-coenzyme A ligase PaaK-like adenylate-forming protein
VELVSGLRTALDLVRVPRRTLPAILSIQQRRLADLVGFARERSPFYRELYGGVAWTRAGLSDLPPVTKEQLNARIETVVTDPTIRESDVEAFLRDQGKVGQLFRGRFVALRTAGTTGRMGAVLYDREAWHLFKLLGAARGLLADRGSGGGILRFLMRRHRIAYLVAAGGHFSTAAMAYLRPRWTRLWADERVIPITMPEDEILTQLEVFRPEVIHVYPTFADALAAARLDGRLTIDPVAISTSSEPLSPDVRELVARAFPRTRLVDCYGATECLVMARQCGAGPDLHVNVDWVVLEPVDSAGQPVPYGEPSHRVLVTNLANRVMPFIRYVLEDVVTPLPPAPCPCGSNLPRIRIQGRIDDTIWIPTRSGPPLAVRPLALGSTMTRIAGLRQFQAIQEGPHDVRIRFVCEPGANPAEVGRAVRESFGGLLAGAEPSEAVRVASESVERIERDSTSGKIRRIFSRYRPAARRVQG